MPTYYSQLCCLNMQPAEAVDTLIAAGATHIELMLDGEGWRDFDERIAEHVASLRDKGVSYAVHVPVWDANLTCENQQISQAVMQGYRDSIRLAVQLGAKHVVVHPGFCQADCFDKDAARDRATKLLQELISMATPFGIRLLVENVGSNLTSLYNLQQFVDYCRSLPAGAAALVDIGHAHINGWDLDLLFAGLGDKLAALHLHDNAGVVDSHNPIGYGTVDWAGLAGTLRKLKLTPDLVLEYSPHCTPDQLASGRLLAQRYFG